MAQSTFRSQNWSTFGLGVEMPKKGTRLWREAHLEVKTVKAPHVRTTFGCSSVVLCGRRNGFCTLSKVSHGCGSCSNFKNDGRRGAFEEHLQRYMTCCMAGAPQETLQSDMIGGQGADFLRGVLHFGASDHQVC